MKDILDKLFGNGGAIIPTAARVNTGDVGYTKLLQNDSVKINTLANLACLLYKGNLYTPYAAVIENDENDGSLFVSCAGNAPRLGWSNIDEIQKILVTAQNYLSDKCDFFQMFKTLVVNAQGLVWQAVNNESLRLLKLSKVKNTGQEQKQLFKKQSDCLDKLVSLGKEELTDSVFNDDIPQNFVVDIVKKFFQDINLADVQYALKKSIEIVPWQEDKYLNVHVEAKGVYHASQQNNGDDKKFTVGLVTIKESRFGLARETDQEEPGCCTGCSAEFNALANAKGFEITRIADYRNKFPPSTNYKPSANVTEDGKVLKSYAQDIFSIINNNNGLYSGVTETLQGYHDFTVEIAGLSEFD